MVMLCLKTQLNGLIEMVMAMATMTLKKQPKLTCSLQTALNGTILMATVTEIIHMVPKATGFPDDPTRWRDSDQDATADEDDAFPNDATQQVDSDGDGYGDNIDGNRGDVFPNDPLNGKILMVMV